MDAVASETPARRPRFRRAAEPPPFRLTDDDVEIVRHIARHRFISSAEIAALVGRSIDRTNDRLLRLYHAGYVDRPRAQIDRFPVDGLGRMIYAIADRGARLLAEHRAATVAAGEWARKNREARRPFIEHQTKIAEFRVALECAAQKRGDVRVIDANDLLAATPNRTQLARSPFALRAKLSHNGAMRQVGVVPDLVCGLMFPDGSRRCFMVEIDRGTMPIVRAEFEQTSFERKMRVYLTAYAAQEHQRLFGWKAFRVLVVTTSQERMQSMIDALRGLHIPHGPGASLFFFATFDQLRLNDPLAHAWLGGNDRMVQLI